MIKIGVEDIKEIIELCNKIPQEYRQKCFELLLSYTLHILYSPSPIVSPEATVQAPASMMERKKFVIPIDVKAFLNQYGLDESILRKFFYIEGTGIRPQYALKETKKAKAQIQIALMMALEKAISSGQFQVDMESLRARCREQKCYDDANFLAILKRSEKLFKSIEDELPLTLSTEGKSELADLLERLKV